MKITALIILQLISFTAFQILGQKSKDFVVQSGHSSEVTHLEFSHGGNFFASAGLDHNIVLWDLESGKQIRTLAGHRAEINALIFMPGDSILGSCSNDSTIRFWNTSTGELIASTKTTFLPTSLSYSEANNKWYIAAKIIYEYDLNKNELKLIKSPKSKSFEYVYALNSGKVLFGNKRSNHHYQYIDSTIKRGSGAMLICDQSENDPSKLVIATKNGNINLYQDGAKKVKFKKTLRNGLGKFNEISDISVRGDMLVYMTRDNAACLMDLNTGLEKKSFLSNYYNARAVELHPSKDLVLTGANDGKIYLWDVTTGVLIREFKSNSSSINFAKFSKDGNKVILGYDAGLIRIWDLQYGGTIRTHKFQLTNRQTKKGWRYRTLSLTDYNDSVYTFKIALTKPYPGTQYFKETRYYDFVWNVNSNKKSFTERFVNNYEFGVADYSSIVDKQNLVFQNDSIFIVGNGTFVDEYLNDQATNTGFQTPHTNPLTSVDYHIQKDIYLTASWDGKILLYDSNRKMIASLVALGVDDFVIVNTDNYYYATKGALQYVGFASGLEIQSFQQFDLQYNRPEIVYNSIPYGNEEVVAMLEKLHEKRLERSKSLGLNENTHIDPPSVKINSLSGPVTKTSMAKIHIQASDNNGLRNCQVKIDGVPAFYTNKYHFGKKSIDTILVIELQGGINKIDISAVNIDNVSSLNKSIFIRYDRKQSKPDLYFVGIGVSEYEDTTKNLKYATKDIMDVEKTFVKSKTFNKTNTLTLFNNGVVLDSLTAIDDFLADAKVGDAVIIYYAGHGMLNKELEYYLASYDNNFYKPEERGIPYQYLEDKLVNCKSRKKLLFLDACHSGEVDTVNAIIKNGDVEIGKDIIFRNAGGVSIEQGESLDAVKAVFADLKESNGITVISSAGGADYAIESDQWENGAFTYCLTKGLKSGLSDLDANGVTTVSDLLLYLQINVPIITHGYQVPTYRTENIDNDFVLWKK
ncbi:MAG: caspase family protein [Flavobacteriales bacterium]|nr:caspase family protein [Flavobacteriales bacterium]